MTRWGRGIICLSAIGLAGTVNAQGMSPFNTSDCVDRTSAHWCPSQAGQQGWKLTYKSESPRDLMDKYWNYEIWMRADAAVLCMFEEGRGGIRVDRCFDLRGVSAQ